MRALRIIGIILGVLLLAFVVTGLVAPKKFHIKRTEQIAATPARIFPYLKLLEKQNVWSPWMSLDPNIQTEIVGTDGQVGAISKWSGNEKVGKGSQEITAIEPQKRVETRLRFLEPWESEADAYLEVSPSGKGSEVTWGLQGRYGFMESIIMLFMDMEGSVGSDYEKGLQNLKTIVEGESAGAPASPYEIRTVDLPERHYIAARGEVRFEEMAHFYEQHLSRIMQWMTQRSLQPAGQPCGLYYTWEEAAQKTRMAAAIPVSQSVQPGEGLELITLPAGKAAQMDYYGGYDGLGKAHEKMEAYLQSRQLTADVPAVEEYVTDPGAEPDTSRWLTRLYYPLKADR